MSWKRKHGKNKDWNVVMKITFQIIVLSLIEYLETRHPWFSKGFHLSSLGQKWEGAVICLNDGLEITIIIQKLTSAHTLWQPHIFISLSRVQFSTACLTPFSVIRSQRSKSNCSSPQQLFEITYNVSSSIFVSDKFNTSNLGTWKFIENRFCAEQDLKFKWVILQHLKTSTIPSNMRW